ncbi:MAG: DUF2733 domain-containing protein [Verrucomicrobia bacterium]|nr:DUF2733 domain-containing protein [Verrucomicrobiota bacterium]MBM3871915.1 DUF2733 domain-containing protein [Verrucomicrobiota bacterium]
MLGDLCSVCCRAHQNPVTDY